MARLLPLLMLSCLLLSVSCYAINNNLLHLAKRASIDRHLYVGDKTKEEYKNDLAWLAYFPVEKLQGARYEWLNG